MESAAGASAGGWSRAQSEPQHSKPQTKVAVPASWSTEGARPLQHCLPRGNCTARETILPHAGRGTSGSDSPFYLPRRQGGAGGQGVKSEYWVYSQNKLSNTDKGSNPCLHFSVQHTIKLVLGFTAISINKHNQPPGRTKT